MGYRERPVTGALADLLVCGWRDSGGRTQRVLPDGCIDLLWLEGRLHVAGPDTTAFLSRPAGPVAGLRFRPGVAPGVLGVPAHVLRDQRVPLEQVWPGAASLAARIEDGADPLAVLAGELARRREPVDPAPGAVARALAVGRSAEATADALGWTSRTLHRRCNAAFGYGPSVLRRILRFRSAVHLAGTGVAYAEAAARSGYADQAHLSREVRALAGVPLRELLAR